MSSSRAGGGGRSSCIGGRAGQWNPGEDEPHVAAARVEELEKAPASLDRLDCASRSRFSLSLSLLPRIAARLRL